MRILITNVSLRGLTGTEAAVRDISLALAARGHRVDVFSRRLGGAARRLMSAGINVVSGLDRLHSPPDVIHGHHNIPAVAAMAHFRDRPCIWFCRDTRHWFDTPPRLERVFRYVALDAMRRDFLVVDNGCPADRVSIFPNAFDPKRFPARGAPLPARPRRAVAFTKTAGEVAILRAACESASIGFAAFGRGPGNRTPDPEPRLAQADLVFATGRSAQEAIFAGAAVIVADARGIAGLVTTSNFDAMRAQNFGRGAFDGPMSGQRVSDAIAAYDADDAARVSARLRNEGDIDDLAVRLEKLYAEAAAAAPGGLPWSAHDLTALRDFRREWPARRLGNRWRWRREAAVVDRFLELRGA